jgi:hypothetical protein
VLVCTSTQLEPAEARFQVRSYSSTGGAPFVVLALGRELTLHFGDLETLTALAVAVAEARDLLLTAALLAPDEPPLPVGEGVSA